MNDNRQLEAEAIDWLAYFVYGVAYALLVWGAVALHSIVSRGM